MEISRYFIQEMADAYILFINGKQEEALKKVLPLSEHFTLDISPQKMLADFYAEMGENEKLVEWCKRIIIFIEYNEIQASWPYLYLGYAYEYGIGVEEDLMKAFEHYHIVWCSIDHNDKNLDEFFERHPEMLKLPRVQETLNPFADEEEY